MRETVKIQPTLAEPWLDAPYAKELKVISDLLDNDRKLAAEVVQDLRPNAVSGRRGMSGDQVLRSLILKQMYGYSYEELAFHLVDSRTFRTFCGFGLTDRIPKKATLAATIKRISPKALERINRRLVEMARTTGIEKGRKVRIDSTVVETNIHDPSDSSLLWDCVRVLTRLMKAARDLGVPDLSFPDRRRRAKRRAHEIQRARGRRQRKRLYRDLLSVVKEVSTAAQEVMDAARIHEPGGLMEALSLEGVVEDLKTFLGLTARVVDQTRRRVLNEETVPAREKLVSIFEDHTDVIVKKPRETRFGHLVNLTGGASSMILDCVIAEGNPADSSMATVMVDRQKKIFGRPPRQVAFDGGYASKANLKAIKEAGVKDVVFHKRRGLQVEDMAKSPWVYRRLRDFRAGIEGCISFLKRSFGMDRVTWKGLTSFKSYVWACIVSMNLLIMARHLLR